MFQIDFYIIQLFPEGEGVLVDRYRLAKRQGVFLVLCTNSEGDSCFIIYQSSRVKIYKAFLFVNERRPLVRALLTKVVFLCFGPHGLCTPYITFYLHLLNQISPLFAYF